jgi:hypothetical protein
MNDDGRPALLTPGAMYAIAGVLEGAGVLGLFWNPWAGGALIVAGLACQWRARVARDAAVWHEWNDPR